MNIDIKVWKRNYETSPIGIYTWRRDVKYAFDTIQIPLKIIMQKKWNTPLDLTIERKRHYPRQQSKTLQGKASQRSMNRYPTSLFS